MSSGYVFSEPAWIRQTAGFVLVPVAAGALLSGLGCAGLQLAQVMACDPIRAMIRHHDEIETPSSLSSTSTLVIAPLYTMINSGSSVPSTGSST